MKASFASFACFCYFFEDPLPGGQPVVQKGQSFGFFFLFLRQSLKAQAEFRLNV